MKKLLAFTLCLCLISPVAYADDNPPPPTKLEKGITFTPPADGWFFTVPAEKKLRYRLLDADYFEKAFKLEQDTVIHMQTQIELHREVADKYRASWLESDKRLTETLKRENRTKFFYLATGILLTIGAGFAIGYAAR